MAIKLKRLIRSFWFQVAALCSVAALAVTSRVLLLPYHGRHQISPFFAVIEPYIGAYTLLPLLAFTVFFLTKRIFFQSRPLLKWAYAVLAFFAFTVTVNAALGGFNKILPGALWQYCFDARIIYGFGNFLRDYQVHVAGLHWHTTTHPPGIFVYLYPLLKIAGDNWTLIALWNALVGGAGAIFVYKAAEECFPPGTGNVAALLYITAPNLVLYGSTTDAPLCTLGAIVIYFLALYLSRGQLAYAIAAGLVLAAGFFTAYHFGFFGSLLVCLLIYSLIARKNSSRNKTASAHSATRPLSSGAPRSAGISVRGLALLAVAAGASFIIFFIIIYLATGFDIITSFRYQQGYSEKYFGAGANVIYFFKHYFLGAPGYSNVHRSYVEWVPGNAVAFFFLIGPGTTVLFFRYLWEKSFRKTEVRAGFFLSLAAAASFLLVNISGLTLGEAERIWLFMVPWFLGGAGYYLKERAGRLLYPVLILNLGISWLFVIFFRHIK